MKLNYFAFILCVFFMVSCNSDSKTYVTIKTEFGDLKVELYDSTPNHKENFLKRVDEEYYKDLLFHRVIAGFMVQGGDPNSRNAGPEARLGGGGPKERVDAEIGAPHFKGTLAAARQPDAANPEKKSSGSQFYLVQGSPQSDQQLDNWERTKGFKYNAAQREKYKTLGGRPDLDAEYTVFGEVVEGIEIIDQIAAVPVGAANRPLKDIKMNIIR
ncbi:MAG: peptidylprolyl isomerase [Saprospiraceae bacterium]|nr:peptidylprolyl isomerase [Saprospiraceae bacterium]